MAAFEPAVGALLLAFDEAGATPDRERLLATIPPAALYETRSSDTPVVWL